LAKATVTALANLQVTIEDAPAQSQYANPVERSVQTITKSVSTLLHSSKFIDDTFWGIALLSAIHSYNCMPNKLSDSTPMKQLTNITPDLNLKFLYPFGSPVVSYNLHTNRFKFKAKGELGLYIGSVYNNSGASYIYIPERNTEAVLVYKRKDIQSIKLSPDFIFPKSSNTMITESSLSNENSVLFKSIISSSNIHDNIESIANKNLSIDITNTIYQ